MKAIVYERYGPPEVVHIQEIDKPAPGPNEVLIRSHATTVTAGDSRVRSLRMPAGLGLIARLALGITGPRQRILGTEFAGVIESIGSKVTNFKPGDHVFAFTGARLGCHVEYKCMPADGAVALKPARLTFEEAASISSGGTTALYFLREANPQRGQTVLIVGASGAVGSSAVQLAKHFGLEVTGVCGTSNMELVRSLGADHVIDYTKEDFTKNGKRYDIIVDTTGTAPFRISRNSLREGGRLLLVLSALADTLSAPWISKKHRIKIVARPAAWKPEDLRTLATLADAGAFTPVIDRRFSFEQIQDAHRYVDTGRKKGSVVITLNTVL